MSNAATILKREFLRQAKRSLRTDAALCAVSQAAIRSSLALLSKNVVVLIWPLTPEGDQATGNVLRDAENAVWTNPRLRAVARAALQASNPTLLIKLTGGMVPLVPNSP